MTQGPGWRPLTIAVGELHPMSACGTKPTFAFVFVTSAFDPKRTCDPAGECPLLGDARSALIRLAQLRCCT